jgi:serine protease inhibitor
MKKIFLIIVIILAGLLLLIQINKLPQEDPRKEYSPKELHEEEPSEDFETMSNIDFSLELFSQLANEGENLFISPYSIFSAILIAYAGSEGETKKEIERALHLNNMDTEMIKEKYLELKNKIERDSEPLEINIANAVFLRKDFPFRESFKQDASNYFEAKISYLPQKGIDINNWVKEKTNNKIEDLIDPGQISEDIISYIINAIYFQGSWAEEFDKERTKKRVFYSEKEGEVDMMERESNYHFLIEEDVSMVAMEYKNTDYIFYAIMPSDLSDFYNSFNANKLKILKDKLSEGNFLLRIPKFELEDKMTLSSSLKLLGIEKAFDQNNANFSNMVKIEDIRENVYISEVFHSSYVKIDEEGTEAAAATGIEISVT